MNIWESAPPGAFRGACYNTSFNTLEARTGTLCVDGGAVSEAQCRDEYNGDYSSVLTCPQLGYKSLCDSAFNIVTGDTMSDGTGAAPDLAYLVWAQRTVTPDDSPDAERLPYSLTCSEANVPVCTEEQYRSAPIGSSLYANCPCGMFARAGGAPAAASFGLCPFDALAGATSLCTGAACAVPDYVGDACTESADCPSGFTCVPDDAGGALATGRCAKRTSCTPRGGFAPCPAGSRCDESNSDGREDGGTCVTGCLDDADCRGDGASRPDSWDRLHCVGRMCRPLVCDSTADGNKTCESVDPGLRCVGTECVRKCPAGNVDCPDGEVCSQSSVQVCGMPCTSQEDCESDQTCNGGACVSGCRSDAQCGTGSCVLGNCVTECVNDADCNGGGDGSSQYCASNNVCAPYQRDANRGRTKPRISKWVWVGVSAFVALIAIIGVAVAIHKRHAASDARADAFAPKRLTVRLPGPPPMLPAPQ